MYLSGPFITFTTMNRRNKIFKPGRKNPLQEFLNKFKNSLIKDLKIKIFGLLFAIIMWIYIILGNSYTYTFSVPLNIVNISEEKTLKEPVPERIKAELTGQGSELLFLYLSPISGFRFELDIQAIQFFYTYDLHEYYQLHPEKIIFPRNTNISLNNILAPDSVRIQLDYFTSKKIPVIPNVFIDTEPGYIKSEALKLTPDSVLISGPKYYIDKTQKIYTDSLVTENTNLPVVQDLKLLLPENTTIKCSHKKATVYQKVEQIGEKIVKDIPVKIINTEENITLVPSPDMVSLKVSAALSHLTDLAPGDFEVIFDYKNSWKPGETYYQPKIIKPQQVVDIIEIIPERLDIRVVRERVSK
ncbi:MAG: hypothetical protein JXQ65_04915 [Candidatus Marinimicrobia bacterium]|nr:hypothetical protein [Candidatus Neomarinimicrobiota bacterium]